MRRKRLKKDRVSERNTLLSYIIRYIIEISNTLITRYKYKMII